MDCACGSEWSVFGCGIRLTAYAGFPRIGDEAESLQLTGREHRHPNRLVGDDCFDRRDPDVEFGRHSASIAVLCLRPAANRRVGHGAFEGGAAVPAGIVALES